MVFFKICRKSIGRFSFICLAMLVFVAPVAWLSIAHPAHIKSIGEIIAQNHYFFLCFRVLFIISIFLVWSNLVYHWGRKRIWSNQRIQFWQHQRLKILLWLILFELVLCDNVLLKLIHLLGF